MKLFFFLFSLLFLFSCDLIPKDSVASKINIDWEFEMTGVGWIGTDTNSLDEVFTFFPADVSGDLLPEKAIGHLSSIQGDTLTVINLALQPLFRHIDNNDLDLEDSSSFMLNRSGSFIELRKISGHEFVPEVLYFSKSSIRTPEHFQYQHVYGFDRYGKYCFEIDAKGHCRAKLFGDGYTPYSVEILPSEKSDHLFINSYLNMITETRYDTIRHRNMTVYGAGMEELFVSNDSVYTYDTYFLREPGPEILVGYLRSKINSAKITRQKISKTCYAKRKYDLISVFQPLKDR